MAAAVAESRNENTLVRSVVCSRKFEFDALDAIALIGLPVLAENENIISDKNDDLSWKSLSM